MSNVLLDSTTSSIGYHPWRRCGGTDSVIQLLLNSWRDRSRKEYVVPFMKLAGPELKT